MDYTASSFRLKRPTVSIAMSIMDDGIGYQVGHCATELMNAAVSVHKLHLSITGPGSFAAHLALKDLYEALPGHADDLVEGYQGAACELVTCENSVPKTLNSVEDCLSYIKELKDTITNLQAMLSYSEVINDLDSTKSTLNSAAYKLKFLQ